MKNEIKEILESLDKISKAEYYPEDLLTYKECHLLLDYITNLQEENKKFKNWINVLNKNNHNYKSRIDKAIEYIENNDDEWFSVPELIGILQGSDDNE